MTAKRGPVPLLPASGTFPGGPCVFSCSCRESFRCDLAFPGLERDEGLVGFYESFAPVPFEPPREPRLSSRKGASMARLRLHTPQDAIQYLYGQINYERTSRVPYRSRQFRFARLQALLQRLGNPHHHLPVVHVAGTKGKGSTCAMLDAVLRRSGLRVGRFTSPHLNHLGERLVVDGKPCSPQQLLELVRQVAPVAEELKRHPLPQQPGGPTFFELMTALGFLHFRQQGVELAVMEVGLGGRLDSTNLCRPRLCLITSISFDHTALLGDTLAQIAAEKAGIIKPGVPVISGVQQPQAAEVIRRQARGCGSPLWELGRDFAFTCPGTRLARHSWHTPLEVRGLGPEWKSLHLRTALPLAGVHQAHNAALAVAAAWQLARQGWPISRQAIVRGLRQLRWPARVELIARSPLVVLDAAHNAASVQALVETLRPVAPPGRRWLLFGTSADKDIPGMVRLLAPEFHQVTVTRFGNNPRAADPAQLQRIFARHGSQAQLESCAARALQRLLPRLNPTDLLCVCGSLFLAAELRPLLLRWRTEQARRPRLCDPSRAL